MSHRCDQPSSRSEYGPGPSLINKRRVMSDLSALPEYPRFIPLEREHRALLRTALEALQPEISEFTFSYQWLWRPYTHCRLARFRGAIILLNNLPSGEESYMLPPVISGPEEAGMVLSAVLKEVKSTASNGFARVPQVLAEPLAKQGEFLAKEERGRADYVYRGEDIRQLPGGHFHRKRNHIQQFWKAFPEAEYREMNPSLAGECAAFCRSWLEGHSRRDLGGLQREVERAAAMLSDYQWLGLRGGALLAGGRIAAFALGEPLNRDTFVVRVEKADTSFPGAYSVINQEFARHGAGGFKWINREQDLDLPGLRRAKQSYYPHHLVRKYRVFPALPPHRLFLHPAGEEACQP